MVNDDGIAELAFDDSYPAEEKARGTNADSE
jgi:hypothetical protein